MTHNILQTDIALVTKLIGDQRPDGEILQALAYRKVDPTRAAKLLDDLRNGRKPESQPPLPLEMTRPRRSRSRSEASREASTRSAEPEPDREPPRRHAHSKGENSGLLKMAVVSILILAIAAGAIGFLKRSHSEVRAAVKPQAKPATVK